MSAAPPALVGSGISCHCRPICPLLPGTQELTKSFESTLDAMSKKNHREIEKLESTFAQEMKQELKRIKQMQVAWHCRQLVVL